MFAAIKLLQANGGIEKVRRNLFGEVDHEELKKDLERNMSDDLEKAELKWNFDFKKGIPLEGQYEWVRVKDPLLETSTQEGEEDPQQETTTQERVEDPQQETTTQERVEDPQKETTTQERVEDPQQETKTQERVEDPQQEVAALDGDTTFCLTSVKKHESRGSNCCKRKTTRITDHYKVKRRCSPLPSPSQGSQ
ncbi:uncharacterized protein ACNLHF_010833 isoform 1-T2 [Anomaloglossus baeobatrachus]